MIHPVFILSYLIITDLVLCKPWEDKHKSIRHCLPFLQYRAKTPEHGGLVHALHQRFPQYLSFLNLCASHTLVDNRETWNQRWFSKTKGSKDKE